MKSNYKKLGNYIKTVNVKNEENRISNLLGVSNEKYFIPSIANIHGTDLSKYKIVREGQFVYGPVTSRNGDKISIALLTDESAIVSTSYTVFEIINIEELLPEYLMLWFKRNEFDRYARYMSKGSVRETFSWEEMRNVRLPIPSIEKQNDIVKTASLFEKSTERSLEISSVITEILVSHFMDTFNNMSLDDKDDLKVNKSFKIKDIVDVKNGFAFKSNSYVDDGKYSVVTIGNVQDDLLLIDNINKVKNIPNRMPDHCELKEGDLLMSLTGNIGRTAFVIGDNYLLNQRVCKIEPKNYNYLTFIFALLNTEQMKNKLNSISGGTAQQNLSTIEFENLEVYNVDISKIEEYSKTINMLNYKFYALKNYYTQKELRQTIIPELLVKEW